MVQWRPLAVLGLCLLLAHQGGTNLDPVGQEDGTRELLSESIENHDKALSGFQAFADINLASIDEHDENLVLLAGIKALEMYNKALALLEEELRTHQKAFTSKVKKVEELSKKIVEDSLALLQVKIELEKRKEEIEEERSKNCNCISQDSFYIIATLGLLVIVVLQVIKGRSEESTNEDVVRRREERKSKLRELERKRNEKMRMEEKEAERRREEEREKRREEEEKNRKMEEESRAKKMKEERALRVEEERKEEERKILRAQKREAAEKQRKRFREEQEKKTEERGSKERPRKK